ncbi:MAG: DNA-methyltransferase [Thermoplasmata archaeon]
MAAGVRVLAGDARILPGIDAESVHLVVTSPPYPMIPQWDALFAGQGATDFDSMHDLLGAAWCACHRVLVPGGILAVNVGDALRSSGPGSFRLWPNHGEVLRRAEAAGFRPLPYALWRKPMNRPNAYLGSGFLPPNAYITLDCEFLLLFRKGGLRVFPRGDPRRAESRMSRAERDEWFSQVWTVRAASQAGAAGRRTGRFPEEIPRRLIRMFSVVGDTVLDPFAGTGTTLRVARELGRDSIGVEIDPELARDLDRAFTP